ncbi:hypothetical protein BJ742DRAFT_804940 [Cladochytrium replicatum]|nr:hypothetical protein BJ742DRAFT_804940 [Cladochytrium replicatum]
MSTLACHTSTPYSLVSRRSLPSPSALPSPTPSLRRPTSTASPPTTPTSLRSTRASLLPTRGSPSPTPRSTPLPYSSKVRTFQSKPTLFASPTSPPAKCIPTSCLPPLPKRSSLKPSQSPVPGSQSSSSLLRSKMVTKTNAKLITPKETPKNESVAFLSDETMPWSTETLANLDALEDSSEDSFDLECARTELLELESPPSSLCDAESCYIDFSMKQANLMDFEAAVIWPSESEESTAPSSPIDGRTTPNLAFFDSIFS